MNEPELLPWEQAVITREEVTGGMGLILAGILNNIEVRSTELGLEDDEKVSAAVNKLSVRSLILVNGLRKNTKSNRLQKYLYRSAGLYDLTKTTLNDFADDRDSLVDRIERIGVAVQGDMNVNGLLTETTKRKLQELDETQPANLEK